MKRKKLQEHSGARLRAAEERAEPPKRQRTLVEIWGGDGRT